MMKRWVGIAVLTGTVVSLGLTGSAGADVRVGPNYRLNSDSSPFRGQDQVALAVRPENPNHVVEVNANYWDLTCEASVSMDGGENWSPAVRLVPPAPVGIGVSAFKPSCQSFQSLQFGSGLNVYATATAARLTGLTGNTFTDNAVIVYRSTDGGLTWLPGVVSMVEGLGGSNGNNSQGPSYTRPAVSVDPGQGTGGADRVYSMARESLGAGRLCTTNCTPIKIAVSNNGGASYGAPVNVTSELVNTADGSARPAINPVDHTVTIVWRTSGVNAKLQASRSTNAGATWSTEVDVANVRNDGTPTTTHVPTGSGQSTNATYPRLANDPTTGAIYIVYGQGGAAPNKPAGGFEGADHFIPPDNAVYFQRSLNNGATWSTPKLISNRTQFPGSQLVQTRHPSVSVSPNGRINVVWHDRRHWYMGPGERTCSHSHIFCEDIRLGDTYYSYSTDNGATFSPNIRVTDRSSDDDTGLDESMISAHWNWGPQSVTVANDKVLIGWMDSREGNWDTGTEDIYLAKVDFTASGTAPKTSVDQPDAVSQSVALSKLGYQGGNEGALVGGARDPAGTTSPGGPAARNASTVVIVNEGDVAGALAGGVLARANPGPVLLSPATGLPAAVKAEVTRMSPDSAFLIGDAGSLSAQVIADLGAAGVPGGNIVRLAGANDAATAALVAARMDARSAAEKVAGVPAFDAAVIANPASPDAAAAAGLAMARRLPFLWVSSSSVPAETAAALASLNIAKTLVIGGTSVVGALPGLPSPTRLGGADQYATSQAVVTESAARGLPTNVAYVADGAQPMQAALLGGPAARATGTMLLAPAPLYDTATGQAAAFGLSNVARYVVLGPAGGPPPPAPPVAPPPPPPPIVVPPPVPPLAAGDRTAPLAKLGGATTQKLAATFSLTVTCTSEPCTARVSATVVAPKVGRIAAKTFKPKVVSAKLKKGVKRKVALRLTASARLAIARALRLRRNVVRARIVVKVSDAAGNARTLKRTVRIVPAARTKR